MFEELVLLVNLKRMFVSMLKFFQEIRVKKHTKVTKIHKIFYMTESVIGSNKRVCQDFVDLNR